MQIPPIRYTPSAYRGLPDKQAVRVWYLPDYETIKAFREWFVERANRERANTTRTFIDGQIAALQGRDDDESRAAIDALQERLEELEPALESDDEISAYAEGIGDMISHFEICGEREVWPADPKGRTAILRSLPSPVISDLLKAFHSGDYDDDIVGKS